jgi:hypothetical protein
MIALAGKLWLPLRASYDFPCGQVMIALRQVVVCLRHNLNIFRWQSENTAACAALITFAQQNHNLRSNHNFRKAE